MRKKGTVASAGKNIATVPGAVTNLSLTASDRTITATWSAPVSDGGSAITSYTVETQLNSNGWVSQGSQTSGVSFTVRNNTAVTARSYKVRVKANNAIGAGNTTESSPVTPSFGTPTKPTLAANNPASKSYPSSSGNFTQYRTFGITYTPLSCNAFSNTEVYIARSGYEYTNLANFTTLNTTSTTANQTYTISVGYQSALSWYDILSSMTFSVFTRTWNTDGDYVDSAAETVTTVAQQSYNGYTEAGGTYTSSTVQVNSNTYSITSAYVGGPDRRTDSIRVYAWSTTGTATICTTSRYFIMAFSNNTTGTYATESQLVAPFTTNSGQTPRNRLTAFSLGYGGIANSARIQIRGAGSIASGWNPTISVYFVVSYTDRTAVTWTY